MTLFASGLWRLAGLVDRGRQAWLFLVISTLCIPATVSSARNGQMNLHLAGLMLQATADAAISVWWRAALSLTVGLALKPHALIPTLLIAAIYPPTRGWLAVMIAAAAAFPFLFQHPAYVAGQYAACFERIVFASMPETDTWSDVRGLLIRLGVQPSNRRLILLRLAAAVPTLLLSFAARRHGKDWSAIYIYALAATYMMLFVPRTEANSYVMLAPAVAALAAVALLRRQAVASGALVTFAVAIGCENYGRTIHMMTDLWLKPLLTIVFAVYLTSRVAGDEHAPVAFRAVAQ
jgi:hypothetical protein